MNNKPKENCKYWDKCYQKNEHHLITYNHPTATKPKEEEPTTEISPNKSPIPPGNNEKQDDSIEETKPETTSVVVDDDDDDEPKKHEKTPKKRHSSEASDNTVNTPPKKNPSKRLWDHSEANINEKEQSSSFIHEKFLVKMPKDFYLFWKFVVTHPTKNSLKPFNFELVGPYDFLAGKFAPGQNKSPGDYLRHWRFFYDPPEFQTIFVKKGSGIHYGYWRDDPKDEENLLIVRNDASKGCVFELIATNMFDAFAYFLEKDYQVTPFNHKVLGDMRKTISNFVQESKFDRRSLVEAKVERAKKISAKTFHNVGIVVPVNKTTGVGYRPLTDSDSNIKKILSALEKPGELSKEEAKEMVMEKLNPIITNSVIALDECDFGTNLELGIDLFCSGHKELHEIVQNLLNPAYKLLGRPQYMAILKAHLADRRNSYKLSILD
ncbi:histone PARylation factor 1-like [Episyrphus balteatus]|uniref:histone PARylation factor 1-like n=1 Tax=Episyrphus balteatus TaxID=286459 RepID=UPI002486C80E|nr:histone PARylation factor 1-like [Episyrphus balteatus]